VIGPGHGTVKETQALITKLIKTVKLPLIVDADGLTALAGETKFPPFKSSALTLTPHPGEMGRLLKSGTKEVQGDRIGVCRNFSVSQRLHVVLKGTGPLSPARTARSSSTPRETLGWPREEWGMSLPE
jgi:NAD(P)H-hydrate epimerase